MSVDDIEGVPSSDNYLKSIFERQLVLEEKYKDIEKFPWPWPLDIDLPENQVWLKDVMWRVTEEMTESFEAYKNSNPLHQAEELSDALHFVTQLMLMSGIPWQDVIPSPLNESIKPDIECICRFFHLNVEESLLDYYWEVIYYLGLAGNCLKNRKWKQTPALTDKNKYKDYLKWAFISLLRVFVYIGYSAEEIFIVYFKKQEINKIRQKTFY